MAEDNVTTTTIVAGAADVKPGHKTTEFYIHVAVVILSALATVAGIVEGFSRGTLSPSDAMLALGGVATATLSALGYTTSRTIVKNAASVLLVGLLLTLSGCTAEQIQSAEAKAHAALLAVDSGIGWVEGHPESVSVLLDAARQADPENATLQAVVAKAKDALDKGDLERVQALVRAGALVTSPPGPTVVVAPPVPK